MTELRAFGAAQRRAISRVVTILATVGITAGCFLWPTANKDSGLQTLLNQSRAKWTAANIHNYEYDYNHTCNCSGDSIANVHITVEADTILSVFLAGSALPPNAPKSAFLTVLQLFDLVQRNINGN